MQVHQTYNPKIPPLRDETSGIDVTFSPLDISTSVTIHNILSINEQASMISLKLGVSFEGSDYRLTFNFLNDDSSKNTINGMENIIWTPRLTVLIKNDRTKEPEEQRQLTIKKQEVAVLEGSMEDLNVNEIEKYPFDIEKCSVEYNLAGSMTNQSNLIPLKPITNLGPASVGQYSVKGWQIESGEGIRGVRVTVELGRSIGSIFTVTFLPTILMNLVNQATTYSKNNYDLVMTVNITCMMVLASVYISVSSSLPLTAGMKYIEIWFLFNLAYPVMVIIVNIFLQVWDN